MKLAAAQLDAMPVIGRDFLRSQVTTRAVARAALPRRRPERPARGLGRHPQARQAATSTTASRASSSRCASDMTRVLRRLQGVPLRRVPGPVRNRPAPDVMSSPSSRAYSRAHALSAYAAEAFRADLSCGPPTLQQEYDAAAPSSRQGWPPRGGTSARRSRTSPCPSEGSSSRVPNQSGGCERRRARLRVRRGAFPTEPGAGRRGTAAAEASRLRARSARIEPSRGSLPALVASTPRRAAIHRIL
jgi:hypothetical protein